MKRISNLHMWRWSIEVYVSCD